MGKSTKQSIFSRHHRLYWKRFSWMISTSVTRNNSIFFFAQTNSLHVGQYLQHRQAKKRREWSRNEKLKQISPSSMNRPSVVLSEHFFFHKRIKTLAELQGSALGLAPPPPDTANAVVNRRGSRCITRTLQSQRERERKEREREREREKGNTMENKRIEK